MAEATAVAEKPEVVTQAAIEDAPQAVEGTGDPGNAEQSTDPPADDTPAPEAKAPAAETDAARIEREAREAELENVREETRREERARIAEEAKESKRETAAKERSAKLKAATDGFGPTISAQRAELVKLGITDADEQAAVLAPLEGHNGRLKPVLDGHYQTALDDFKDTLVAELTDTVPEGEARDAFVKSAENGDLPLRDILTTWLGHQALDADAVKTAKPDDLTSRNSALKAARAKDKADGVRAGRAELQDQLEARASEMGLSEATITALLKTKFGEPAVGGGQAAPLGPKNAAEAAEWHANWGTAGRPSTLGPRMITSDQMRRYQATGRI